MASGRDAASDDMKTHGFLLGKFMPPHAGHLYCAEVGKARCNVMTVLVCSHDAEPIDGYLRAEWMRECLSRPGYRVLHMHRDIPQAPEDHHDFWPIWRAAIAEFHPEPIDWVFGSEGYVHRLAQEVDARPFPVDPERQVVPVSATAIREDLTSNWSHVPVPVRSYYQRRLVLVGAESTGKTVLSEALAARLKSVPIPEYGRDYDAVFRHGQDWVAADFEAIMAGHKALADTMAARGGPIIVEDTDALQTLVWAEALLGKVHKPLVDWARSAVEGKSYLLLDHATPWEDDGTRHFADPARRAWFTGRLRSWLDELGAEWKCIEGEDWAERTAAANFHLDTFS
ncbi:AAA family ATPase [Shimia sp. Alg240-R146]|uniref:AAA family ATPase n=1 Tax=Shimia sp. Alg240-R146 TaxID=2993449 RepID=UPI0022E4BC52|nr:AAA family ATPase [Shimia sp. Alg240-R146]